MKNDVKKGFVLGAAAALLLYPREVKTGYTEDEKGRKLTSFRLRTGLFRLDYADKTLSLDLLPLSDQGREKIRELIDKVQEKKKEKQLRPLFKSALELVSKRNSVDADYLCRKLGVGQSCGEAFIEMMEEMGVLESADDGKYRVIMTKKEIEAII